MEEIAKILNVVPGNESAYQAAIQNATSLSVPATVEQLQQLIDEDNSNAELNAILDSSVSTGAGANANAPSVSMSQLQRRIIGLVDLNPLKW